MALCKQISQHLYFAKLSNCVVNITSVLMPSYLLCMLCSFYSILPQELRNESFVNCHIIFNHCLCL